MNYKIEEDTLINKYLDYLLNKGIIIKNQSNNYILKNLNVNENMNQIINSNSNCQLKVFNNNVIENANNLQILKKKKILFKQLILQLFIKNDNNIQNKKIKQNNYFDTKLIVKDNKEKFQIFPLGKKHFQKQLMDSISLTEISEPELREDKNNIFKKVDNKKIFYNIDKTNSFIIKGENLEINKTIINSNFEKRNKITKYIIQKNEELNILQKRKVIISFQTINNFSIFTNIKKQYQKSNINTLFIPSKNKAINYIQKIEDMNIINNQNKNRFYIIENIINLFINSDSKEIMNEEEESKEGEKNEKEDDNIIEIDNIEINNNKLRAKNKRLTNKNKLKNPNDINDNKSLVIFQNENLFIASTYDMLLLEKTWENLEKENIIKNLFLKGSNNNPLITENKSGIKNEIKIEENNNYKIDKKQKRNKMKDWNKINFPVFNNKINIFPKNSNLSKKKEKLKTK